MLVRGRWCVVTRTGWVIGLRYSGPRLQRLRKLPSIDPLARHCDALTGLTVVLLGAMVVGAIVYGLTRM